MVGAERFELPTLCSQSRCATRLRYAPTLVIIAPWAPNLKSQTSTPNVPQGPAVLWGAPENLHPLTTSIATTARTPKNSSFEACPSPPDSAKRKLSKLADCPAN